VKAGELVGMPGGNTLENQPDERITPGVRWAKLASQSGDGISMDSQLGQSDAKYQLR
jgi:hypothetical protein